MSSSLTLAVGGRNPDPNRGLMSENLFLMLEKYCIKKIAERRKTCSPCCAVLVNVP